MYCRYCGKELPNDSYFCPNCGKKQVDSKGGRVLLGSNFDIINFIQKHKIIVYSYFVWLLLHTTLFISSEKYDRCNDRFYPFNMSFSYVIQGGKPTLGEGVRSPDIEFLGKSINYYDLTEYFAYVILLPLIILGIVRSYPIIKRIWSVTRIKFLRWQAGNKKNTAEYQSRKSQLNQRQKNDNSSEKDLEEEMANLQPTIVDNAEKAEKSMEPIDINSPIAIETPKQEPVSIESASVDSFPQKMGLFCRFVGSIIDKILILIIFVVGSIAISPYGAAGRLGTYMGLMNSSPNNYEYIDREAMNRYGTYIDGVSQYYQDRERLANEPPHIGSTMELDMNITFSFIILNLLFYIIFESFLSASLGKRLLGGVLLDNAGDKIGFIKAFIRVVCGGVLMSGVYILLHLFMGLSNYVVVFAFFLLLDLPVLFTKRSLLDICTGTKYVNVLTKEDWNGKYGEPDILVKK